MGVRLEDNIEVLLEELASTEVNLFVGKVQAFLMSEELFARHERKGVIKVVNESFNINLVLSEDLNTVSVLDKVTTLNEIKETTMETSNNGQPESFTCMLKQVGYTNETLIVVLDAWFKEANELELVSLNDVTADTDAFEDATNIVSRLDKKDQETAVKFSTFLMTNSPLESNKNKTTTLNKTEETTMNTVLKNITSINNVKWIAAGTAVLGSGLEHLAVGEITIGSAVGGVAGVGLSYWAVPKLVDKIKSEKSWLNMSAAGTAGLALGAGGSALGRVVENIAVGFMVDNDIVDAETTAPSITIINYSQPETSASEVEGL